MGHTLVLNTNWEPISIHPMSELAWFDAIPKIIEQKVYVLHEYENWIVRSPSRSMHVPAVVISKQYVNVQRFAAYTPYVIKVRDNFTCQYCLNKFREDELTMDHVIPESHGGLRRADNLVAACAPCNQKRGNDTSIQPRRQPWRPTRSEIVTQMRKHCKTIPHVSWIPYIDWPEDKIRIGQPVGEPGYREVDDPFSLSREQLAVVYAS